MIFITGRFEEGTAYHRESLAAYRELGDDFGTGHLLFRLAVEAQRSGTLSWHSHSQKRLGSITGADRRGPNRRS